MQYWTIRYTPIPKTRVAPHIGLVLLNTTLDEVFLLRLGLLPCLPYTHADAATKPLVGLF